MYPIGYKYCIRMQLRTRKGIKWKFQIIIIPDMVQIKNKSLILHPKGYKI
jgi:hypothetical protein